MQFITKLGILILTLVVERLLDELTSLIAKYLQKNQPEPTIS